jgi:hypothetical protein
MAFPAIETLVKYQIGAMTAIAATVQKTNIKK